MRRFGWVVLDVRDNFLQLNATRQIGWCRREEDATLFGNSLAMITQLEARFPGQSFFHMPAVRGKTGGRVH